MIQTSTTLLPTEYTPSMQKHRMVGYKYEYGIRSRFTNRPTSGRFNTSSTTLPTYMLATNPQNSSGCCVINMGPGEMPWTMIAANITAVIGPVGMPSANIGTNAPVAAALFADSGPATPSIAPLPKRSGCFDI